MEMRVLTVRQPWAWLIFEGGKNIENRSRPTKIRERIAIHSSGRFDLNEGRRALLHMATYGLRGEARERWWWGEPELLVLGCIVGTVEIVDCVTASTSPWFAGPYGFGSTGSAIAGGTDSGKRKTRILAGGGSMATAEQILLTAKMLEARNQLVRVLGDRYEGVIAPVRDALRAIADGTKRTALSVAQENATRAQESGNDMAAWQIIAAAVDVCEGK